jgi:hypothetical protein
MHLEQNTATESEGYKIGDLIRDKDLPMFAGWIRHFVSLKNGTPAALVDNGSGNLELFVLDQCEPWPVVVYECVPAQAQSMARV